MKYWWEVLGFETAESAKKREKIIDPKASAEENHELNVLLAIYNFHGNVLISKAKYQKLKDKFGKHRTIVSDSNCKGDPKCYVVERIK